ncbi:MAG: glycosyltransferase [Clostridia bacterium]|nr:glycosyltransferase [Clostridia bacterium]
MRKIKENIKENVKNIIVDLFYHRFGILKKTNKCNKKNIMILVSRLNNGGAERTASNIADELSKKYNVILVTQENKKEMDYKCNVRRIELDEKRDSDSSLIYFLKQIKQLKKIKKEENITHTISFCTRMNYFNVMSKVNDETIISIRNYLSKSEKDEKNFLIIKKSAKYADKIVVVSEVLIEDQVKNFNADKQNIYVINNFLDEEKIESKFIEDGSEQKIKNEKVVLNVGRLTYQKGQVNLINAFRKVVDALPDAKLVILGQGNLKDDLEKRIKLLSLSNNVYLMGFQDNPYMYMKKSQLFVLSSFYEGMSNVILEAMYCGLPIISTDCKSGTRELLAPNTDFNKINTNITREEYGILVPVIQNQNDEKLLAEAIIELLRNRELREKYSNQSKKRAKEFSKDKIMKKWIEIIEE